MRQNGSERELAAADALDLEALQALCDKATPGPWLAYFTIHGDPMVVPASAPFPAHRIADASTSPSDYGHANCEWIAAATSAVPALIDEVARLKALLAEFGSGPPKDSPNERELCADDDWEYALRCVSRPQTVVAYVLGEPVWDLHLPDFEKVRRIPAGPWEVAP